MKKSNKFFTIILLLTFVCSAFVTAAFADDTAESVVGVRLDAAADFENPIKSEIMSAEEANSIVSTMTAQTTKVDQDNSSQPVSFKHQGGGEAVLVQTSPEAPYNGNTYITVDWTSNLENTVNNQAHFIDSFTTINQFGTYTDRDEWEFLDEIDYFIYDFDIMFDDPSAYSTGAFSPYIVYTNAAGKRVDVSDNFGIDFVNNGEGSVIATLRGGSKSVSVGSLGAWDHITFIMDTYTVEDESGTNNLGVKTYLAINGEVVDVVDWMNQEAATTFYNEDRCLFYILDVRLLVFGANTDGNRYSAKVDNVASRTLLSEYNGNLNTVLADGVGAELSNWESNIYNDAEMPFGNTIAKINDDCYDSLQDAIDAAEYYGTVITLCSDIKENVKVNKIVTIECGDYVIDSMTSAEGYLMVYDEETKTYTTQYSQGRIDIVWRGCTCGLDICDESHPGSIDTTGWADGTMGETYTKSKDWSITVGPETYTLVGWADENGTLVDINAKITLEQCNEGYIELTPVIDKVSIPLTYESAGETKYTDSLATAVAEADAGSTVTLNADVKVVSNVSVAKNIKIDLNGHAINNIVTKNEFGKKNGTFLLSAGCTITIIGEKEGSEIICGYVSGTTSFGGVAVVHINGGDTTVNFQGEHLNVSAPCLVASWQTGSTDVNIDGGCYSNNEWLDQSGFILQAANAANCTVNVENATVKSTHTTKRYLFDIRAAGNEVTFDNCVLIANAFATDKSVFATGLITNCYVDAPLSGTGKLVLGGGNSFTANGSYHGTHVALDDAVTLVAATETSTLPLYVQDNTVTDSSGLLVVDPSSYIFAASSYDMAITKKSVKAISVNFYNGEILVGSAAGLAGTKVVGPQVSAEGETFADGWVVGYKSYAYTIPANANADITVDITEVTEYSYNYVAGTPALYYNYALTDNLQTNLYVPAVLPEGIAINDIILNNSSSRTLSGNYTINGVAYQYTNAWPTAWDADDNKPTWTLSFTYDGAVIEYTVQANVLTYVQKIVDIYAEDTEKLQQATALLQYVETTNILKGDSLAEGLSDYLDELQEKVTLPAVPTECNSDYSQLSTYISGAKVTVNPSRGGSFALTLSQTAVDAGVNIQFVTPLATCVATIADGVAYTDNTNITKWAASDMTINVIDGEGVVLASGTYGLAAYYNEVKADATADELEIIEAMYALAVIGDTNK